MSETLDRIELSRLEVGLRLAEKGDERSELGQYFTPLNIARFMAGMARPRELDCYRVLDAGAGIGILTAAVIEAVGTWDHPPRAIHADLWELDEGLADDLRSTLDQCRAAADRAGIECRFRVHHADFIRGAVARLSSGPLFGSDTDRYDLAILNPPYRKLRSDTAEREMLSSIGIEASNLYAAFTWLALELLGDRGDLVAITPRSYMNGTYFRPFRQAIREKSAIRRVHIYDSRTKAFAGDAVLQENAIIHAERNGAPSPISITTSEGPEDTGLLVRQVEPRQLCDPNDPDAVIHVVPDETDAMIGERMRSLPNTLADLGLKVSTGRVVDFRARPRLRERPCPGSVPLIFPRHLKSGTVAWPDDRVRKPNAIIAEGPQDPLLMPSGWYVLIKRFSAKEEKRRVVASIFSPEDIADAQIGFDNKLNVIHQSGGGVGERLARGLAVYLNSTFVDSYFRQFSGHTQVNAGDLRSIRFPSVDELVAIGRHFNGHMPDQDHINTLLQKEISIMSETDDPIDAKRKTEEAVQILKAINAPRAQQNERSALTLLGLLDLAPASPWSEAGDPLRGVTELMDWMAKSYGKRYAPNTRETIRRFTLHQFIEMGLVLLNPDDPGRPPNSPKNVYQIEPSARALLARFGSDQWEKELATYLESMAGLNRMRAKPRQMMTVPITLPDGAELELSAGGQNVLIKQIVEEFAPRFTPGGRVLYLGDAGEKHLLNDAEYLAELGVTIDPHGKMPDVVIHYTERDWLVLVEAVTSHGPVNILRHNQLKDLFSGSTAGLVYVTAFLDRGAMREYLPEIAWETEVWVADAPGHLIHFNGERFLGPYAT